MNLWQTIQARQRLLAASAGPSNVLLCAPLPPQLAMRRPAVAQYERNSTPILPMSGRRAMRFRILGGTRKARAPRASSASSSHASRWARFAKPSSGSATPTSGSGQCPPGQTWTCVTLNNKEHCFCSSMLKGLKDEIGQDGQGGPQVSAGTGTQSTTGAITKKCPPGYVWTCETLGQGEQCWCQARLASPSPGVNQLDAEVDVCGCGGACGCPSVAAQDEARGHIDQCMDIARGLLAAGVTPDEIAAAVTELVALAGSRVPS